MGKLPKSIIKKHGITKKAWQIFKKQNKKITKRKASSPTLKRSNKMAKRRKSSRKKQQGFKLASGISSLIGPLAYGMFRERISDALANTQIVQKLPVTEFTDEAVMLGINWGARKFGMGKIPVVNGILRAQKQIELARIGQTIADMQQNKVATNNGIAVAQSGNLW